MASAQVFYDILHPTVDNDTQYRSEDEQVNGLGFYRTVADGVEPLLIERVRFPTANMPPAYSVTSPADASALAVNELFPQITFHTTAMHYAWQYTINSYAWTTVGDQGAILAGADSSAATPTAALIEGIGYQITHQAADSATNPSFVTHRWEMEQQNGITLTDPNIVKGTFLWEGTNAYFGVTLAGTFTSPHRADGSPVRFWSADRINNAPGLIVKQGLIGTPGGVQTSVEETASAFYVQVWEDQFDKDLEEEMNDVDGNINSEDSQGRHATHLWEIDQHNIVETRYWIYQDAFEDSELGEVVETDNNVPPPGDILSIFQEHAFLAGDPENPHYLYWSKRFKPESWPLDNFSEIGTANDPIRAHMPVAGVLGVFTTQTKYRVSGNSTTGFIHDEAISHRGAPSPNSVLPTDKGVLFVARDGVFSTNFIGPDQKLSDAIDPIFYGETKNGYDPINWDQAEIICAGFYKNKFYFSYPSGTSTTNNMTALYAFDTQQWTFWDVGFNSFYAERDTDLFLAGGGDSLVYVIDDPATKDDDGADIDFELETRDFTGTSQTTRNLFLYFKVDAECDGDEITVKFYVDGSLISTQTIDGSRSGQLMSLPENTFGKRWHIAISYTGNQRIAIHGATTIFIPLLAA